MERRVVAERVSLMSPDANLTIDFRSDEMLKEGQDSYTVLRGPFDQWLASKAEEAGAEAIYGIAVESLLKDGSGKVAGVRAAEDEISADVVVLCDGVNSLLTAEAVGFKTPEPHTMAVGIKQVIELPSSVITDRIMAASDNEGAAWLFAGDATHGHIGGGFMYTNRDSVSLGIVATISDLMANSSTPIYQMLEDLKRHPSVAPLIRGGKVVEHSGHMVPEGGFDMMPDVVGNGVLLAGESAMMCVNLGYQVRGMDYAIAAGQMAGIEAAKALDNGDTSKAGLLGYRQALEDSFVLKDLRQFRRFPHFMEATSRIFNEYPALARDVMNAMFVCDGAPVKPLRKSVMPLVKQVGLMNVVRDVRGGVSAL